MDKTIFFWSEFIITLPKGDEGVIMAKKGRKEIFLVLTKEGYIRCEKNCEGHSSFNHSAEREGGGQHKKNSNDKWMN